MKAWETVFQNLMIKLILYTPQLTAGHLKKMASGIRKNSVKYFASGIHRNYG